MSKNDREELDVYVITPNFFLKNRRTLYRSDVEPDESVSVLRVKLKKNKFLDMTVGKAMDISRKRKLKKVQKRVLNEKSIF